MNFWQQKILPASWRPKNTTHLWMCDDNEKNFAANPRVKWQGVDIQYKYNSDGFRTHEFSDFLNKQVNIALGCSHTEGLGLPIEHVWPSLIEKKLNTPLLNLGLGGGSSDTVARILTNISGLFQIQKVFILWPEKHRFECYDEENNKVYAVGPWSNKEDYFWNMSKANSLQRLARNQTIVNLLSKQYKFETVELLFEDVLKIITNDDPARDSKHYGMTPNIQISEWFISLIKQQ